VSLGLDFLPLAFWGRKCLHIDQKIGRLDEHIPQEKRGTTCAGYFQLCLQMQMQKRKNG
jgi:hypothetical protein